MGTDREPTSEQVPPGYRVLRVVATTGMSVVYEALHKKLQRKVALKVIHPRHAADKTFRARFDREVVNAARMAHDNIVVVYDAGVWNDHCYVAMQWIDGPNLGELVRERGRLALADTVAYTRQIAGALDAAHRKGIVHRDVKPGNVLVRRDDGRVYLCDFGIAKQVDGGTVAGRTLTPKGAFLGSVPYTAPEQIEGRKLDARADEYALACTVYECLTGEPPFPQSDKLAVLSAHLYDPPPRASDKVPDLPKAVSDVLVKAMAKDPGDRYPDCVAFAAALADAAEPAPPTVLPSAVPGKGEAGNAAGAGSGKASQPREPTPSGQRNLLVALAAVVVVFLAVVAGAVIFPGFLSDGGAPGGGGAGAAAASASTSATVTGSAAPSTTAVPSATTSVPNRAPTRPRTPPQSQKPRPKSPSPTCRQREQYVVKQHGEIFDGQWKDVGDVNKGDLFVRLDKPPNPPPSAYDRYYGRANGVTGYVLQRKLEFVRYVCV